MTTNRSREDLAAFLDYVGSKGLMPKPTVQARKAAASQILGILSQDEAQDVTLIDIDAVMNRFNNLNGKGYTPDSLKTYKSRLTKALEDFESYLENPMAFRPASAKRPARGQKEKPKAAGSAPSAPASHGSSPPIAAAPAVNIIPISIRADLTVHVQGIPFDMTAKEAQRIANVIIALANGDP
jgi:hypothetical protein